MTHFKDPSLMLKGASGSRQFLGDYNVVAQLVFEFANEITVLFDAMLTGERTSAQCEAETTQKCVALAAIFKGQNPAYEVAQWRSEGRLEGKMVGWVPDLRGDGDVMLDFFKAVSLEILKGCRSVHEGMAEEQAGPMLKVFLQDVTEKLTGIQP